MTVPMRGSSLGSAMIRSMEHAWLAGLRLIVAGEDLGQVQTVRQQLAALGAEATALAGDADAVARAAVADPPAPILALDGIEGRLRGRLDPFGLETGPPVFALASVSAGEGHVGPLVASRLRVLLERRALRNRQAELESVLA